jgi:3-hydroxymyristoyl/3-hydroxydecanoyl-(acyl carrier protein) dehydratase
VTATASRVRGASAPAYAVPLRAVDHVTCAPSGDGVLVQARLAVGADPEVLRGHFPGLPIYPGVYVLESLAQALTATVGGGRQLRLRAVHSARFLAPLLAGDELRLEIEARPAGDGWQAVARCHRADGTLAAQARAAMSTVDGAKDELGETPRPPELKAGGLDRRSIPALLPQRHPFLLIDRVCGVEPGRMIVAEKAVTATEPCYREQDERWAAGADAYPVCLMLESLGQAAALLWLSGSGPVDPADVLMFAGVRGYRVTGAAYPGDVLRHVVELAPVRADTAFASGATWVGGRRIATVDTLIAVRRPRSVLGQSAYRRHPTNGDEEEFDDRG